MNLNTALGATKDRHATRAGDIILGNEIVRIGDSLEVFQFVSKLGSEFFRIIYQCLDGKVRDMIGRQGVFASKQDGEVEGIGPRMRNEERLNLSFWTDTRGGKVNIGAGKGYRTIRAAAILAIKVRGTVIVTDAGIVALREARVSE